MIKVLIADDQTLVRQGIRSLLELCDEIEVIGEAGDGEEVLTLLQHKQVDVLLLDLQMPRINGIQVLEALQEQTSSLAVIVLSTFDTDGQLMTCAKLGARGYLLKDVSLEQLTSTITRIAAGELLIQPTVTERVIRGLQERSLDFDSSPHSETLTPRELEVMRYLAGGYSNREIAVAMHLSEGTVKNHVSAILAKFGVRDRTRAVLKAIDLGLLS